MEAASHAFGRGYSGQQESIFTDEACCFAPEFRLIRLGNKDKNYCYQSQQKACYIQLGYFFFENKNTDQTANHDNSHIHPGKNGRWILGKRLMRL